MNIHLNPLKLILNTQIILCKYDSDHPVREIWVLFPTRVIGIGVWLMAWSRLEIVHICSMLNMGRGKWVPYLAILSHMI